MMILMTLALAGALQTTPAQDAPVATVAPPVMVTPPTRLPNSRPMPKGSPGNWVTDDDYPADALSANMQGVVVFALDVDAGGIVAGCSITRSSGWPSLDDRTCALLKRRGRFYPALDGSALAVPGQFKGSFEWRQPGARMSLASGVRVLRLTNEVWRLAGCTDNVFGDAGDLMARCAGIYAVPEGIGSFASTVTVVEAHHAPGEAMPSGYVAPAGKPIFTRQVALEIDAYGFVRRCTVLRERGKQVTAKYIDGCPPQWTYAKLPDPAGPDRKMILEVMVFQEPLPQAPQGARPGQ